MIEDLSPTCKDCNHAIKPQGMAGYIRCSEGYGIQIKGRAACCQFIQAPITMGKVQGLG